MSSGASRWTGRSIRPALIARTAAAHSNSPSRSIARIRPFGVPPTEWHARPMRWRSTAIDRGDPT
jgi:hypothetical protein